MVRLFYAPAGKEDSRLRRSRQAWASSRVGQLEKPPARPLRPAEKVPPPAPVSGRPGRGRKRSDSRHSTVAAVVRPSSCAALLVSPRRKPALRVSGG